MNYQETIVQLNTLKLRNAIKDFNIVTKHSVLYRTLVLELTLTVFGNDFKPQVISVVDNCEADDARDTYERLLVEAFAICRSSFN